jgi:hypothetical protein
VALHCFHQETPDEKLLVPDSDGEGFFSAPARKSRDCAGAYTGKPHTQDRKLTPPERKRNLSGQINNYIHVVDYCKLYRHCDLHLQLYASISGKARNPSV